MKKTIFLLLAVMISACSFAQKQPYNIVFDISTADTAVHARLIRMINIIMDQDPNAKVEVVFYGKSIPMVTEENSTVKDGIQKIVAAKKANFAVCEIAMKANNIVKTSLLPGVNTVPDGLYELVKKQAEGYGYIKIVSP